MGPVEDHHHVVDTRLEGGVEVELRAVRAPGKAAPLDPQFMRVRLVDRLLRVAEDGGVLEDRGHGAAFFSFSGPDRHQADAGVHREQLQRSR